MFKLIITTSKGLDELLKTEVEQLLQQLNTDADYDVPSVQQQPGQVSFIGTLKDAYQLCLHSSHDVISTWYIWEIVRQGIGRPTRPVQYVLSQVRTVCIPIPKGPCYNRVRIKVCIERLYLK